jgi:acyl-CoA synthetase (AMP-forming)/AMP-acid ligase II/thioesterase domain-containing protein/acyl carrier protein
LLFAHPDPDSLVWLEDDKRLTFRVLLEVVEERKRQIQKHSLPPGSIVAVGDVSPLDLFAWFLALIEERACAPVSPRLTEAEQTRYLEQLRPSAIATANGELRLLGEGALTDAALLLSTSGTTGRPKIARLTRDNLIANARQIRTTLGLTHQDRLLSVMPLHHALGFASVLGQWSAGGSIAILPALDVAQVPRGLADFQPTWMAVSPTVLTAMADLPSNASHQLRLIRYTGASLPAESREAIERRLRVPIYETYGTTETGLLAITPEVNGVRKSGWFRPTFGVEMRLSAAGELLSRGPSIAVGYHRDEEANLESFDDERWFHSGDLAEQDAQGDFRITGRIKELINRGAEKVMPLEVDQAVASHPAVREAVTFGVAHPTLGEDVACAVILRPGAPATLQELRRHAAQTLAPEKLPRHLFLTDSVPRSSTGKPQRHLLRLPPTLEVDPSSVPARLLEVWASVLERRPASLYENFYLAGGDSLQAAVLLTALADEFGLSMAALESFLEAPTLDYLAELVQHAPPAEGVGDYLAIHADGSLPPLFAIPPTRDHIFTFRALAWEMNREQPVYVFTTVGREQDRGPGHVRRAASESIDAMRRIQPNGPYRILGHCYGGVVAFEAARQLLDAGQEVASLLLLDTPCPGGPRLHQRWTPIDKLVPLPPGPGIEYQPEPLPLIAHQFYAADAPVSDLVLEDSRHSWRRFVAHLEEHAVPGGHDTILKPPAVRDLVKAIERAVALQSHVAR